MGLWCSLPAGQAARPHGVIGAVQQPSLEAPRLELQCFDLRERQGVLASPFVWCQQKRDLELDSSFALPKKVVVSDPEYIC